MCLRIDETGRNKIFKGKATELKMKAGDRLSK